MLADILPVIVRTFPWPKQMRWGERSANPGALTWVRPLHSIVATFGIETEEPEVVKFAIDGIEAGQTTFGHRFMAPAAISVRRFEDYEAKLKAAKVVLDPQRARTSSWPTPSSWPSRKALSWSRTRCCSTRCRASSNGRSC